MTLDTLPGWPRYVPDASDLAGDRPVHLTLLVSRPAVQPVQWRTYRRWAGLERFLTDLLAVLAIYAAVSLLMWLVTEVVK